MVSEEGGMLVRRERDGKQGRKRADGSIWNLAGTRRMQAPRVSGLSYQGTPVRWDDREAYCEWPINRETVTKEV